MTGRLTVNEFWCLIGLWASMFLFGFFVVDFGETKESEASAFTRFTGRGDLDASNVLSVVFFFLSIGLYVGLLVLLIIGQQGRRERKLQRQSETGSGNSPAWPTQAAWPAEPPGGPAAQYGWDGQGYPRVGPSTSGPTGRSSEPPPNPTDPWGRT